MGIIQSIRNIELSSIRGTFNIADIRASKDSGGLMPMETFEKAVDLVKYFTDQETQGELTLSGLGESLLNQDCSKMIDYAKKTITSISMDINTDIKLATKETVDSLKAVGISEVKNEGYKHSILFDPVKWALESNFNIRYNDGPCPWISNGEVMIAWNGDVRNCFLDAKGESVKVNIMKDDITKYDVGHFGLCDRCCYEKVKG